MKDSSPSQPGNCPQRTAKIRELCAQLPFPAERFIPHRAPMMLIDQIIELEPEQIFGHASCSLAAEGPYFKRAIFQTHWLLELMAQAAAAICQILVLDEGTKARRGYLISIRNFEGDPRSYQLQPGTKLLLEARFEIGFDEIAQCECAARGPEGQFYGRAQMTFYRENGENP